MTEDQIKHMVSRFLGWHLPETFRPDGGISFKKYGNEGTRHQYENYPSGTNLFDATQADAMVRYMIDGMLVVRESPAASSQAYTRAYLEEMSVIQMAAAIDVAMRDPIPDREENPFSTAAKERRAYARTLASAAFSVIPNFALNLASVADHAAIVEGLEFMWKSNMERGDKRGEDMAAGINNALEYIRSIGVGNHSDDVRKRILLQGALLQSVHDLCEEIRASRTHTSWKQLAYNLDAFEEFSRTPP